MIRSRRKTEESGPKVPGYIVTFSDMVTLLLTFFVLLLSLAQMQDPELFETGRDAFWESIHYLGLGPLFGRKETPDFNKIKIKHLIKEPDYLSDKRTIDAKEEKIRRTYKKVARSMTTMRSQIVAKKTNFSVTNIRFSPSEATLNKPAKEFLTQFALSLQQNAGSEAIKLYVLGLANDETTEKKRWILSAKRAQAASEFLSDNLSELRWPVYSWGIGSGGYWVEQGSPVSKQSQILIAVLRTNE